MRSTAEEKSPKELVANWQTLVRTFIRPENVETTALGAAYLAGMAVGVFGGLDSVKDAYRIERSFEPQITRAEREGHLRRWRDAVRRARSEMEIT